MEVLAMIFRTLHIFSGSALAKALPGGR